MQRLRRKNMWRLGFSFLWVGLGFLIIPSAHAKDLGTVIKEHLDSRGGYDRVIGLLGYRMTGTITIDQNTLPIRLWWKRPNKLRIEIVGETVSAYDGRTAWTEPSGKDAFEMADDEKALFIQRADWQGPFVRSEGVRTEADKTMWSDDSGYKILVHRGNAGESDEIFLNAASHLTKWEKSHVSGSGFKFEVEQRYSKFRSRFQTEGIFFPYHIDRFVDGELDEQIDVDKVTIEPALDDKLFAMPTVSHSQR